MVSALFLEKQDICILSSLVLSSFIIKIALVFPDYINMENVLCKQIHLDPFEHSCQVREHAAAVLAGLMKGGDEDLAQDFRHRAYAEASIIQKKRKQRFFSCFSFTQFCLVISTVFFSFVRSSLMIILERSSPLYMLITGDHPERSSLSVYAYTIYLAWAC